MANTKKSKFVQRKLYRKLKYSKKSKLVRNKSIRRTKRMRRMTKKGGGKGGKKGNRLPLIPKNTSTSNGTRRRSSIFRMKPRRAISAPELIKTVPPLGLSNIRSNNESPKRSASAPAFSEPKYVYDLNPKDSHGRSSRETLDNYFNGYTHIEIDDDTKNNTTTKSLPIRSLSLTEVEKMREQSLQKGPLYENIGEESKIANIVKSVTNILKNPEKGQLTKLKKLQGNLEELLLKKESQKNNKNYKNLDRITNIIRQITNQQNLAKLALNKEVLIRYLNNPELSNNSRENYTRQIEEIRQILKNRQSGLYAVPVKVTNEPGRPPEPPPRPSRLESLKNLGL
jgi:hypothetical protein